jgi:hypothetical protein
MDSRLVGVVTRVDVEWRRAYITTPDQQYYFASLFEVEPDAYGNQGLILREAAEFTSSKTKTGRLSATAVVRLDRPGIKFDSSYRDTAVVTEIDKPETGWARRTDGSSIRWSSSDVITYGVMGRGVVFRFQPRKPKSGRQWEAAKIEIYKEDSESGPEGDGCK